MFYQRTPTRLFAAAMLCVTFTLPALAQVEDDMEDVSHFHHNFGDAVASLGEDSVVITRSKADVDAGVDWSMDDGSPIPLDENHERLTLTPDKAGDGGYFVASVLFFNQANEFIAEQVWLTDTNKTHKRTLASVKALAEKNDIKDAAGYKLRLRINPVETKGASFAFKSITATPAEAE